MAETHVISALTQKRAELSGKIKQLRTEIEGLEDQLDHIDGAIKIFDPNYDLRGIRPRMKREKNSWFDHGELPRLILDAMREAKSAITKRAIFEAILHKKGLTVDSDDEKAIQKAIDKRLRTLEEEGTVIKSDEKESSNANLWSIA